MKESQQKQIENHLLVHGKITSWKAITTYGITRLSAYINILRNNGWTIDGQWKHNKERRWKIYHLKTYPNS